MSTTEQQLVVAARQRDHTPHPATRSASVGRIDSRVSTKHLTGAQKAAIIVRLALAEGVDTPINSLPADMQAQLTQTLGNMRLVDRATLSAVVEEFIETLEQVGLSFPEGLEGALSLLEGKLAPETTVALRALSRGISDNDPWVTLENASTDDLLHLLGQESQVVGAVLLSKLSTDKAAKLLMQLPADQARSLAIALGRTEDIAPETVARIGATLADQISAKPIRAFSAPPSKRMGDILNASPAAIRDQLLRDIEGTDDIYATGIRKSIFTYQDIGARLGERDVPTVMRDIDSADLVLVLAAGQPADAATNAFLLDNMSKRMSETLREDAAALPPPEAAAYETASTRLASAVRGLADTGEIILKPPPV